MDNDTVSLTNINRQSIALHSTMGQFKTRVMKDKIADICPDTQVITFEEFVLPDNMDNLFEQIKHRMGPAGSVDYILDAIDTVTAKLAL
ncbi:ThiF family adenylyltransferase, partial [Eggerthella lenta]|nr:ThiF family adenylyltransferase [Eggerthella lenta]